jgi:hypothetical protein
MKQLARRLQRLEATVFPPEEGAPDDATALGAIGDYRLILCREGNDAPHGSPQSQHESTEAALARWGLTPADLPEGLDVYYAPCLPGHCDGRHSPPMLLRVCSRSQALRGPTPPPDLAEVLTAAQARSPAEQDQWAQACWEQARETLRRLRAHASAPCSHSER